LQFLIKFWGKILSIGKIHGIRRKDRESATKVHPTGKCVEGGKCAGGRQHVSRRIKKCNKSYQEDDNPTFQK